ncbi:MAG: hypothetical protein B6D44_15110 [Ignavibacteriales bacterium UTCHB2]|jgi:hypothetical protein|nr:MAG: hypothetical protein B6D44_15110 [Ignavibacteriales bacterium UTCHB2]
MIEINTILFVIIIGVAFICGFLLCGILAGGRDNEEINFYQELLIIKEREITELESEIDRLKSA